MAVVIGAVVATVAGARFGPTGVPVLDVALSVVFIVAVTEAFDGFGNADGLVSGVGGVAAAGVFAIAAFGRQDDLATVALGLTSACFAFLAFNLPPASLFVGRAGRLAVGYALGVGVLVARPRPGPGAVDRSSRRCSSRSRSSTSRWWRSTGSAAGAGSPRTAPTTWRTASPHWDGSAPRCSCCSSRCSCSCRS